ncbi:MAG TPA: Uma2 family endonuclease [Actinophytocola sp.]|nr:Uma2 family endonuclease [Actinophytocola sp.]
MADYAALGETAWAYTELVEMSPSPPPDHARALAELATQIRPQRPERFEVTLDLDLGLAPPDKPGFSRRPDLIVIENEVGDRVSPEGGMARASDVHLVVKLVFPGAPHSTRSTCGATTSNGWSSGSARRWCRPGGRAGRGRWRR